MSAATQQPQQLAAEKQGSRWLYSQPDEGAVKEWFDGQHLHMGMHHEPYYGGIVLIGAVEKYKTTVVGANGATFVREQERTVYTPYVKVDTRIDYFWTLVDTWNLAAEEGFERSGGDPGTQQAYYGVIEPCEVKKITNPQSPFYNEFLPDGFFIYAARGGGGENAPVSRYICAQYRVAIYERESYLRYLDAKARARYGERINIPAALVGVGTKQTLMAKNYPDDNAIMKAETGAIGRALGVAGILNVGTGIATAEDIQEAQAAGSMPTVVNREGEVQAQLPGIINGEQEPGTRIEGPDIPSDELKSGGKTPQDVDMELRERATALSGEMRRDYPEAWEKYLHWYQEERKFPSVLELSGAALRGAVVKLERELDAAKNPAPAEATDAAAPPGE